MSLPTRYAWCFSHGFMHTFDPDAPWCTATWVWLDGDSREAAEADKQQRYGDAQFLHHLPADRQYAIIIREQP